ncbi:MAG: tripartite tricarboxylate transporter permease [Candidatus Rokuibacteriota bacterium]
MWEAAGTALVAFADPYRLSMLLIGLLAGGIIGMMPGLGGVGAVSVLLPFVLTLDPFSGLAVLLGATGVVYTSDTIAAILFGTPTSASSGPTAIEGFAMARRGEAGRALGGAFLASMIGGLIGAVVLTLAIPIAGPLVLALGTGELLMLAIVGLAYASGLVGDSPTKGILSATLGLLLGTVGVAPSAPELRFTLGIPYLLDGFALTILALGLFGVAEVIVMLGQGGAIAQQRFKLSGWADGVRDVGRQWKVVVMGSVVGVIFGVIPAVGASASTWIAYGQAVATAKDRSMIGKGDPRGMLAAEGANNATITTDLVPTLLFAVPGGPAAAVFLGALFVYGYYPGPRFVQMNLDLMFLIVWSSALAAVLGAALCFAASPWIARVTRIEFGLVAAPLIAVILLGSFETKKSVIDFAALFGFGVLGWLMKRAQWPRAPLLVGFVLTDPIERNFWLAYQLHGWSWLRGPIVIGLIAVVVVHIALTFRRALAARQARPPASPAEPAAPGPAAHRLDLLLALGAAVVFAAAIVRSLEFAPDSRLVPLLAAIPGLLAALALTTAHLRGRTVASPWPPHSEVLQLALLGAGLAAIPFTGFLPALGVYLLAMLRTRTNLRLLVAPYAAAITAAAYGLSKAFNIPLP